MPTARELMAAGMPAMQARMMAGSAADTEQVKIGHGAGEAMEGNRKPGKTIRGGVLMQDAIPDFEDEVTVEDFNNLLETLRKAGIIARD